MLDLRNSESDWFLQDKNTVTLFVLEIEQGTQRFFILPCMR